MFDEDRLAGVLELNETPVRGWAFGGFKRLGLFLGDADKDDAIADGMLAAHPSGDLVFALAFLEVDDRELKALNVVLDAAHVTLGELPQEGGRGNRKLQVTCQESNQSGFGLQAGDVTVEVKTVQTLDGESDALVEDRFNRGQGFGRSFVGDMRVLLTNGGTSYRESVVQCILQSRPRSNSALHIFRPGGTSYRESKCAKVNWWSGMPPGHV